MSVFIHVNLGHRFSKIFVNNWQKFIQFYAYFLWYCCSSLDFVETLKLMSVFPIKNLPGANHQGFPYWGKSSTSRKFSHCTPHLHLEKLPPPVDSHPLTPPPSLLHQKSIPSPLPSKQQFPSYKPIETTFLAFSCSHCSGSIFVLISYSLNTQVTLTLILVDVQYSQKAVFSFEKGSNRQNHSSGFPYCYLEILDHDSSWATWFFIVLSLWL